MKDETEIHSYLIKCLSSIKDDEYEQELIRECGQSFKRLARTLNDTGKAYSIFARQKYRQSIEKAMTKEKGSLYQVRWEKSFSMFRKLTLPLFMLVSRIIPFLYFSLPGSGKRARSEYSTFHRLGKNTAELIRIVCCILNLFHLFMGCFMLLTLLFMALDIGGKSMNAWMYGAILAGLLAIDLYGFYYLLPLELRRVSSNYFICVDVISYEDIEILD